MNIKKQKFKIFVGVFTILTLLFAPIHTYVSVIPDFSINANAASYTYTYYKKYTGTSKSIVTALQSIGVSSTYSNRKSIAVLNGITNYTGTASQNTKLLNLLKQGKLIKKKTLVSDWEIDMASAATVQKGKSTSFTIRFRGTGISSCGGTISNSNVAVSFSNTKWVSAGQWCSVTLNITGKKAGTSKFTFKLKGSQSLTKSVTITITDAGTDTDTNTGTSLAASNLSKVKYIKQGSKTCKATSVAMALNLLTGTNTYTTARLGNNSCTNINGKTYKASDGSNYIAAYKTDTYKGSASEQKKAVEAAVNAGIPIVAAVHSTNKSKTQHHWIVIVGKSGSDYKIVDPASGNNGTIMSGNVKTMSSANYAFGLNDYKDGIHYGYVAFTKK